MINGKSEHKNFRKGVALTSMQMDRNKAKNEPLSSIHTHPFPGLFQNNDKEMFIKYYADDLLQFHNFIREPDGIKRYLVLMLLAGFRMFSKRDEAKAYAEEKDLVFADDVLVYDPDYFVDPDKLDLSDNSQLVQWLCLNYMHKFRDDYEQIKKLTKDIKDYDSRASKFKRAVKKATGEEKEKLLNSNECKYIIKNEDLNDANKKQKREISQRTNLGNLLITSNANGLSRVFGMGMVYFYETPMGDILEKYGIHKNLKKVHVYLSEVRAIVKEGMEKRAELFKEGNFSDYRSVVKGDMESWLTTFEKNLVNFDPENIVKEQERLAKVVNVDNLVLLSGNRRISEDGQIKELLEGIDKLKSLSERLYDSEPENFYQNYKLIRSFMLELHDKLVKVNRTATELIDNNKTDFSKKELEILDKLSKIDIKEIGKLNSYRKKTVSVDKELNDKYRTYKAVRKVLLDTFDKYYYMDKKDLVSTFLLGQHEIKKSIKLGTSEELFRLMLEKLSHHCQDGGDLLCGAIFELLEGKKYTTQKFLKEKIYEKRGRFWISPYAKRPRNAALPLTPGIDYDKEILAVFSEVGDILKNLREDMETSVEFIQIIDFFALWQFYSFWLFQLPHDNFLTDKQVDGLIRDTDGTFIQEACYSLKFAKEENAGIDKIRALERNVINGCQSFMMTSYVFDLFAEKQKVKSVPYNRAYIYRRASLIWLPKDAYWQPEGKKHKALYSDNKIETGCDINLKKVLREKKTFRVKSPRILHNIPGEMYLDLGFGPYREVAGIKIHKETKWGSNIPCNLTTGFLVKINSASKFNTSMLNGLFNTNGKTVAEHSINYKYYYDKKHDPETDTFSAVLKDVKVFMATPINTNLKFNEHVESVDVKSFDKILGIDLNQRNFGWAVVNNKGKVLESGEVDINALHSLHKKVKHHRKYKMVRGEARHIDARRSQKNLKENAAGDIIFRINQLMKEHEAIPYFEHAVGKAESVGDKVVNSFVISGMKTHNQKREHLWYGASGWRSDIYENRSATAKERKEKPGKFIAPGASTTSKGTSQRCSICRKHPLEFTRDLDEDTEFTTNASGELKIDAGMLVITAPNGDPIKNKTMKVKKLRETLFKQLRYAGADPKKDTYTAKYRCAFVGCRSKLSSQVNAAVNIARNGLYDLEVLKP